MDSQPPFPDEPISPGLGSPGLTRMQLGLGLSRLRPRPSLQDLLRQSPQQARPMARSSDVGGSSSRGLREEAEAEAEAEVEVAGAQLPAGVVASSPTNLPGPAAKLASGQARALEASLPPLPISPTKEDAQPQQHQKQHQKQQQIDPRTATQPDHDPRKRENIPSAELHAPVGRVQHSPRKQASPKLKMAPVGRSSQPPRRKRTRALDALQAGIC
jgi:hypothetical protein